MSRDVNGIEGAVGLTLKGLDVAVEVDDKIVPDSLAVVVEGRFQEEWLYF